MVSGGILKCEQGIRAGQDVQAEYDINVVSGIQAGGSILAGGHVETGWGMIAGHDIVADGAIRSGEGLEAGGRIEAGEGHGVYAGLRVRVDAWPDSARVAAARCFGPLLSGHWIGAAALDAQA
ncbi:hypothetical protein L546_2452 [Bordetella pertussis H897]|nr:hypothetical protein L546_2452 [Bordetella pertussis H897]